MSHLDSLYSHEPQGDLIHASWKRCRAHGLLPNWRANQKLLSEKELRRQQEETGQLRRLAMAETRLLERSLAGSGRILLLADSQGVILDSQGDLEFLGRARRVSLMPGADWTETVAGTNAVGTALIMQRFVRIIGPQHFFEENRFLACNAMPILSPAGEIAGVLDISGNALDPFASASRLVRHAVAHIEHEWALEMAAEVLVRVHAHPSWLNTPEEGVLSFEEGRLRSATVRGLACVGLTHAAIGYCSWEDVFEQKLVFGRQELRLRNGGLCYASVERVHTRPIVLDAVPGRAMDSLQELKNDALRRALVEEKGNVSAASRKLGVHRSTFYRMLRKAQSEKPILVEKAAPDDGEQPQEAGAFSETELLPVALGPE